MARVSTPTAADLADRIDAVLPQTQCRRCGYDGCRPYAEAVAEGAPINRCPPGADAVVAQLAAMTGRPVMPLDVACGEPGPLRVARITEVACIGCTLCIDACPVDAIVGAAKRMHTVLAALCTGCELCIAPCPVDCIAMVAGERQAADLARRATADAAHAADARRRYDAHRRRAAAQALAAEERRQQRQARLSARRSWDDA